MQQKVGKNKVFFLDFNNYALILIVLTVVLLAFSFYSAPKIVAEKNLEVKFLVGQEYGLDLDNSVLTFGMVVPGGSMTRKLQIENNYEYPVKVKIFISESIKPLISVDSEVTLPSGENITLPVSLNVPSDMIYGEYTGNLVLKMFKQ